jgi:hypothetical protein
MSLLHDLRRDCGGAALVEFALVLPMLLLLSLGVLDFGLAFWKYAVAEKAAAVGARWAATRGPLYHFPADADCFTANGTIPSGTSCAVAGGPAGAWVRTCPGDAACQDLSGLVAAIRKIAPFVQAENVEVEFRGSTLGYVGRGAPAPLITVRLKGLTYDFVAVGRLLGGAVRPPVFAATFVGEDQNSAGPSS